MCGILPDLSKREAAARVIEPHSPVVMAISLGRSQIPDCRRSFLREPMNELAPIATVVRSDPRESVLHQLQDERVHALRVFQAVNGADIWMIERREDLSFTLEAGESIGVQRKVGRKDLQGDSAIELCIARAIDLAHAASADGGQDFIRPETGAKSQCQKRRYGLGFQESSTPTGSPGTLPIGISTN